MIPQALSVALSPRYRIVRELGRGGMANVYLAEDTKHSRHVAIKVLQPDIVAIVGCERFLREIGISARLHHPNILPLFDSGEVDGLPFYIMPFVEGESLRGRLDREGQLAIADALHIVMQVADALAYAHDCGVVHRDIKPDNILLQDTHAFVMDFGIARPIGTPASSRMTRVGALVGTPAYMSPEQSADDADIDGRSDIYSLACVCFEMVAGVLPFRGDTVEAILIERFTHQPPHLLSVYDGCPAWLDSVLYRAMARAAADRFQSVRQFRAALADRPSEAEQAADSKSVAVLPFTNMSAAIDDEYFSDGITEEISNALSQIPGLRVVARTSAFAFRGKQEDLRVIGEKLNVGYVLEGSVRRAGSRLRVTVQLVNVGSGFQLWSERYDRDLQDIFDIQDAIASSVASKFKIPTAGEETGRAARRGTSNMQAYELFLRGRALQYRRGQTVTQAITCFRQAADLDPAYAEAMAWMADSYRLIGTYGLRPPQEVMPKARAIAERALSIDPNLDEAYATLADVAFAYDHNITLAFQHWDRALELNPAHLRARCERAFWGLSCLRGDSDSAVREVGLAIDADPLNAWTASMQALVLGVAGRFDDALASARRASELDRESFVANWLLVQAYSWVGEYEAAIEVARDALSATGRHPWILGALAAAYGLSGRPELADAVRAELHARARLEYVQPTWVIFAAIGAGKLDEAMELAERAADEHDPVLVTAWGHPSWRPLHAHSRFAELRERMRFV